MNLFQLATSGIDLESLPSGRAPAPVEAAPEPSPAFGRKVEVPAEIDSIIQEAAATYGVDPNVVRGVAFAESGFDPDVISGKRRSSAGAVGLMQFMPATAKELDIDPLSVREAIFGGAYYLRKNLDKFDGDYGRAVAAYNWGPNRDAFRRDDWFASIPKETDDYVKRVFAVADSFGAEPEPEKSQQVPLPSGVTPSNAGGGRGSVSPGMINTKMPRTAVPDMTVGGVARDVASGLLQIGPTAVGGVGELLGLVSGGKLGQGVRDFAKRGNQSIQEVVGSERAQAQRQNFAADMADDGVSIGQALLNNKGAMADMALPLLGSMLIPAGVAGAAGKAATVGKAAQVLDKAALASRVAAAQQAAGIGATAAQNAASTFAELVDKGVSLKDAYLGAGITVPFSVIAGKLTGGGAEGALIRSTLGNAVKKGATEVPKAMLREGGQEVGEELGQVLGEAAGTGKAPTAAATGKQLAVAGVLGGMTGGGVDVATQAMAPRVETQPTTPQVPVVTKQDPTIDVTYQTADGRTVTDVVPGNTQKVKSDTAKTQAVDNIAKAILEAEAKAAQPAAQPPSGLAAELEALRARNKTSQSTTPQTTEAADAAPATGVPELGAQAADDRRGSAPVADAVRAGADGRNAGLPGAPAPSRAELGTGPDGGRVDGNDALTQPLQESANAQAPTQTTADTTRPLPAARPGAVEAAGVATNTAQDTNGTTTQNTGAQAAPAGGAQAAAQRSQGRVILQNRDRSTPSSIAQMRSIAARPDYGRLGFSRDFANGAPVVAGGTIQPAQMGRQDVATASDGRRIPVQYAVVDAASVLTSNTVDGSSNPSYGDSNIPAVRAIAGNGRIAGLQAAYQSGNADAYRQELVQDAALHGIAPEVIAPMDRPVLVRVMPKEAVTADIGDISNTVGNLDLSAVEQANNDANRVALDALQFAEDGSITTEVVRQFVRAMPQAEQGQLLDTNGQPTRQAVDRLSAAVFAKAYGNEALTRLYSQAQDPEARLVMSALAQVAPKMARLEGAGALDVRDVVAQAAEIAVNARRQGIAIAKAAQQMDMAADPDVGVVLDLFASNSRTVRPVVEAIGRMADLAYTEASKPAEDMFGAVPRASRANIITQLRPENERRSQEALEDAAGRESAAVDAVGQANDPAGSAAPATTEAGRSAEDAAAATENVAPEALELTALSPAQAAAQQDAQEQADKAEAAAKRAEDAAAKAEDERKRIAQASVRAADRFELGQDPLDSLTGQGGLAFSFAGARAATADKHALVTAQDRLSAGEDAESVRQETGWFKGTDGKWRFEINDADAKLLKEPSDPGVYADIFDEAASRSNGVPLGKVLDHPALFAAYPALKATRFIVDDKYSGNGSYSADENAIRVRDPYSYKNGPDQLLSVLLHEIQHGIQDIEGFASGGSPNEFRDESADAEMLRDGAILAVMMRSQGTIEKAKALFVQRFKREPAFGSESAALSGESPESMRARADNALAPQERYRRLAGEVEARNTQARQGMTDEQRRATPPSQTADVADSRVIVMFNGKEMANAPMPANAAPDAATTAQPLRTPASTIRAAITKAYGKLLGQLESKGLVTLTQMQEQAIEAAAQARAAKTGQSVEQARSTLRASVKNSVADQTQTENFQRWFKDSKVVDAEGKPLVVYHGTTKDFDAFDQDSVGDNFGRDNDGFFFTGSAVEASGYADPQSELLAAGRPDARRMTPLAQANVMPVYLSIKNPLTLERYTWAIASSPEVEIDESGVSLIDFFDSGNGDVTRYAKEKGHDGVLFQRGGKTLAVAFFPEQIKSATGNRGTFDPADPDIRRSADGSIQGFFDPQTGQSFLIADNLTAQSAPGTLMHEVGIHMAADGKLQPLFDRAAQILRLGRSNPFMQRVQSRMDAAGETSGEEAAAYIVTEYENDRAGAPSSVASWVKDFIADVRAWLFSKGVLLKADQLSVADIAAVARANARSMAQGDAGGLQGDAGGDIRPSRQGVQDGATDPEQPMPQSKWRDNTGRWQFAPGQWLYDKLGDRANVLLSLAGMKAASPELKRQLRQMKLDVQKAQEVSAKVATEAAKFTPEERAMVSDLVEQTVAAGTLPPEHAVKMADLINTVMGKQTDELVELGMLEKDTADRWRGQYLPRYYESKMLKKDAWTEAMMGLTRRAGIMKGIKGKHLKGRGMFETVAVEQQAAYEALGWEVRDPDFDAATDDSVQMWRDFTPEERAKMGEIRDAGFRFVMGYMQTQKDIALGRMYRSIAQDESLSSRAPTEKLSVRVPDSKIEGTGTNVYGELAGRYVSDETLSVLSSQAEVQNDLLTGYRKALGLWKEGKTVLNPVSHMNNMVSNLTMAHLAGVSYHRVDKYLGAIRDFARKDSKIQEAKDAGLFLGSFNETELYQSMPEELKALANKAESKVDSTVNTAMKLLTFGLRGKMQDAYGFEDDFFKYLIYKDARNRGASPQDAVDFAQQYIFTYDDLPKGARILRDSALPFFSYTYKAVPALLHTALTQPHRMATPAALLYGASMLAYAIAAAEGDEPWDEIIKRYVTDADFREKVSKKKEEDQKNLPPWQRGYTAFMTPKAMLVGHDKALDLPVYMDVSRFIPGGDIFDVVGNAGGLPLPAPITPNHPLLSIGVAMIGNRDLFTGKDLVDKNDTTAEAAAKRSEWMWKQVSPAIAIGNYHWERGMNMVAQASGQPITFIKEYTGRDKSGMPMTPDYGVPQTFGIKLRPVDFELSKQIQQGVDQQMIRQIQAEVRQLERLHGKGAATEGAVLKAREKAQEKIGNIRRGLTVDGDEKK